MSVNAERRAAFEQLLNMPDPKDLAGRGHQQKLAGARDRMIYTWLPAARVWMAQRINDSMKTNEDGWKPAELYVPPLICSRSTG